MVARVKIAEFGIIQKALANAVVTFYTANEDGSSTGIKATLYQATTGTASRGNPQTLSDDGKLTSDCYVASNVVAAITGISDKTARLIKKIKQNPLEFQLPVTGASFNYLSAAALYGDLAAVETAATNASASAAAAAVSETNAETAETNAAASASTATTQAGNAATSASSASTSASNASTSASNASASASSAASSATSAATSATNAAASEAAAAATAASFGDPTTSFAGATSALQLPDGTTAQRPSPAVGMLRYNTTTRLFEGYDSPNGWTGLVDITMLPSALMNITDPKSLGKTYAAFGDGVSRTVESLYGTLGAAQAEYSNAVAGEQIDSCVINYVMQNQLKAFAPAGTYLLNNSLSVASKQVILTGEDGTIFKGYGTAIDNHCIVLNTCDVVISNIEFDFDHVFRSGISCNNSTNYDENVFKNCNFSNVGLVDTVVTSFAAFLSFNGTICVGRIKDCYFEKVIATNNGNHVTANGGFDTDTSWTKGTGWTISGGKASSDGTQSAVSDLSQTVATLTNAESCAITFTVSGYVSGSVTPILGGTAGTARTANGNYYEIIVTGATTDFSIRASDDFVGSIDNVKINGVVYGTYGSSGGAAKHVSVTPSGTGYTDVTIDGCTFSDEGSEAREIDIINQNVNSILGPGTVTTNCKLLYNQNTRRPGKHHEGIMIFRACTFTKTPNFTAAYPVGGDAQSEIGFRGNGVVEASASAGYTGLLIVEECYVDYTGMPNGVFISGTSADIALVMRNCTIKGSTVKHSRYNYETASNQQGYNIGFRDNVSSLYAHAINCTFLGGATPVQALGSNVIIDGCVMNDPMYYGAWVNATVHTSTAQAGSTSTTIVLASGANSTIDNYYRGKRVKIMSGTGAGQIRTIQDYVASTRTATVNPAWTTTPDNTSVYEVGPANIRISNCSFVSRTTGFLTLNTEVFRIQGNTATDVDIYANKFIRAGNTSAITRFINPVHDILGSIHDNLCFDTTVTCVNISSTNKQAKIYNNNGQFHVRADTTTAYTLTQTDRRNYRTLSNAAAITCTLPNDLPAGYETTIEQLGVGQVTFAAASGATVTSPTSLLTSKGQYSIITAKVRTNTTGTNAAWSLSGDLTGNLRVVTAAGAVTLALGDSVVIVNKTAGAATVVNLPATPIVGKPYTIKDGKGDALTNNITITPAAGTIDGAATLVLNLNYQSAQIVYNGTQWNKL